MDRVVSNDMSNILGERIELARKKCGLSLRKLSEAMGGIVSHESIRQLETGAKKPDSTTLIALCDALGVSLDYLMSAQQITLGEVDFRKKSKTTATERSAVKAKLLEDLERYLQVEEILGLEEPWSPPSFEVQPDHPDYAQRVADELRKQWNLGSGPIRDLTELLEEKGLKVCFTDSEQISGLTCEVSRPQKAPVFVIVVNQNHSLERRRFTLAHELGHRVLNCEGLPVKNAESLCNLFAGAFLVPQSTIQNEMGKRRRQIAYQEIMIIKRFFRVSAAMMVVRLEQVGLMERYQRDWYFRTVARTWRSDEPKPLEEVDENKKRIGPPLEKPQRFERLVYQALASDLISVNKASELLDIDIDEVECGLRGEDFESSRKR